MTITDRIRSLFAAKAPPTLAQARQILDDARTALEKAIADFGERPTEKAHEALTAARAAASDAEVLAAGAERRQAAEVARQAEDERRTRLAELAAIRAELSKLDVDAEIAALKSTILAAASADAGLKARLRAAEALRQQGLALAAQLEVEPKLPTVPASSGLNHEAGRRAYAERPDLYENSRGASLWIAMSAASAPDAWRRAEAIAAATIEESRRRNPPSADNGRGLTEQERSDPGAFLARTEN